MSKTPLRFETKVRLIVLVLQPIAIALGVYAGFALRLKGCL